MTCLLVLAILRAAAMHQNQVIARDPAGLEDLQNILHRNTGL